MKRLALRSEREMRPASRTPISAETPIEDLTEGKGGNYRTLPPGR